MTGVFLLTSLSSQQRTKCKARHDAMLIYNSRSCGVKNSFWISAFAGDLCAGGQYCNSSHSPGIFLTPRCKLLERGELKKTYIDVSRKDYWNFFLS